MFSGVSTPAQTRSHQQPASEQPNATPTLRTPHRTAPLQPATGPAPPPTKSPTDASTSAKTSRSILHMSRLIPCTCPELTHRAVHDRRCRKIRDLPVSGRRVTLVWIRRRFVCSNCDVGHLEDHGVFEGGLTRRLARQLVADAKVMSIRAVVRRHGLHWHLIQDLVTSWSALVAEHRRSCRCRVVLVDETSMRKRHRYVSVIVNADTGQVLAMVEHRNAAALSGFFIEQGPRWCRGVKVVVSDGSKSYKAAIDAHLGHTRHVLDRFHVVRWFAAGLTLVRRDLQRRQPAGVKPAFDPGPVQSPLRSATTSRPPQQTRPGPPQPALRHPPKTARPAAMPSKNSTASTKPTTTMAPSKLSTGSPTSTPPANLASSTT